MNDKVENPNSKLDLLKWIVIFILLIAGIVASTHYANKPLVILLVGWLILAGVVILLALQTEKGRQTWEFFKEARVELRKVVWPNRQETTQTTLVVVAMVVITALFLWGVDSFFLWAVGYLTGTRG